MVTALATEDLWHTTGRDIAAWWIARDGITVRAELPQPHRLQLTITARTAITDVGFTIYLPNRPKQATVGAAVAHPPRELHVLPTGDPAIRLVLDDLRAGETRVIDVDLL